jgi:hypothetical protein
MPPRSDEDRAVVRYGGDFQASAASDPTLSAPGGMGEMLSDLAENGIKPETMRKSKNIEDIREPAEGQMPLPGNMFPAGVKEPKETMNLTDDQLTDMLHGYLKGKIKDEDIEKLFPGPDKELRESLLSKQAGRDDIEEFMGRAKLKNAIRIIREEGLKRYANTKLLADMIKPSKAAKKEE